jgi:hypothetical protein
MPTSPAQHQHSPARCGLVVVDYAPRDKLALDDGRGGMKIKLNSERGWQVYTPTDAYSYDPEDPIVPSVLALPGFAQLNKLMLEVGR